MAVYLRSKRTSRRRGAIAVLAVFFPVLISNPAIPLPIATHILPRAKNMSYSRIDRPPVFFAVH